MTQANLNLSAIAAACGADLVAAKGHDDKALSLREAANIKIAQLHKAKAVVGRNGKCGIASAFYDSLIAGKWAKGTANNYLSVFRDAVKTGKPVTDWNPNRKDGKAGKGKGGKGKGTAAFSDLLIKVFNHDEGKSFEALCKKIEAQWDNTEIKTVYAGFVDYLKSEGVEITA